jgi:hypothetical protein
MILVIGWAGKMKRMDCERDILLPVIKALRVNRLPLF